jgi:hypothetical protein
VRGALLSLVASTVIACGDEADEVASEIVRDGGALDGAPPLDAPPAADSAQVIPDAGVDSALPDRAAPDTAPTDSGSDAQNTDGLSVTVSPTAGTITEDL